MTAATIDLYENGTHVLQILDAQGELHAYTLAPAPPGLARWAVTITRLDSGESYRLAEELTGRPSCSCPSFTYRKKGEHACKHVRCVAALRAFLRSMTPAALPERAAAAG